MSEYKLPNSTTKVAGEVSPLATREYLIPLSRKDMEKELKKALDELQQQQQTIKELASALDHALHYIGDADSGFIRQYQALAAQHLKDK